MAFRFRKSVKIAPGIRLNFSKSGVSTSIGRRGATVNISKRGTRVTAGLPGTGISASKLYRRPAKSAPPAPATKAEWATAMFIGFLLSGGIAYAFSGIRAFMVIVSIACLAVFILLVRKPRSQDPIDVPTIPAASASPPAVQTARGRNEQLQLVHWWILANPPRLDQEMIHGTYFYPLLPSKKIIWLWLLLHASEPLTQKSKEILKQLGAPTMMKKHISWNTHWSSASAMRTLSAWMPQCTSGWLIFYAKKNGTMKPLRTSFTGSMHNGIAR